MTPTRASEARRKLDEAICHAGNHAFVPGSVLMALAEFERAALAPHAGATLKLAALLASPHAGTGEPLPEITALVTEVAEEAATICGNLLSDDEVEEIDDLATQLRAQLDPYANSKAADKILCKRAAAIRTIPQYIPFPFEVKAAPALPTGTTEADIAELERLRNLKAHAVDVLTNVMGELRIARDSTKGSMFEQIAAELRARALPTGTSERSDQGEAMSQYRKKPVVIEAREFTAESRTDVMQWCGGYEGVSSRKEYVQGFFVPTLEGAMRVSLNDWIIKGVKGEFYPCKPDIFALTYEPVAAPPSEARRDGGATDDRAELEIILTERIKDLLATACRKRIIDQILKAGFARATDARTEGET